ncbi:MAG TPA: ATP-binding cassette domain-containing protein, partial [Gemmatimonadales bacterium]|nr:ATP-binding cassette domain-containing protein [Gemmatimonadales bacterium]
MTPPLELRSVSKRFGAVQALRDADFVLEPGQLHALLGENGAGKTTLMSIANGMQRPDRGEVLLEGHAVRLQSPRDARGLGIGMVHQHFSAVPAFSAAQNIALAAGWNPSPSALQPRLETLIRKTGLQVPMGIRAEHLSVAQRQALEILMALAADARILLLDEPTAVLAPADAESVLTIVRQFTRQGGAAVLITHKFEEALAYADRITVMRRGRVVASGPASELSAGQLAQAMLGSSPPATAPKDAVVPGAVVARGTGLVVP